MTDERPTVLLVEDNEPDAVYIEELFGELDWTGATVHDRRSEPRLVHAGTVAECRQRLEDGDIDVVLLDLHLPDGSNLDTVDAVLSKTTDEVVVVLTGLDDERVGREAVERGVRGYLNKDAITVASLHRTIEDAMERPTR